MLKKIIDLIVTKKRVIKWVSAFIFTAGAVLLGMNADEFKETVCGAQVIAEENK